MPGLGGGRERASQRSTEVSLHLHQLCAEFRDLGLEAPGEHTVDAPLMGSKWGWGVRNPNCVADVLQETSSVGIGNRKGALKKWGREAAL